MVKTTTEMRKNVFSRRFLVGNAQFDDEKDNYTKKCLV